MKRLAVGILAHVDAGKTTLSEAMLYAGGMIRHLGGWTREMRSWTHMNWRKARNHDFFQAGAACMG